MSFLIEDGILKKYNYEYNQPDVIIPDGVTAIGERAFQNANNIVSVTVPKSVRIIGNSAFSKCGSLTKVTLPESIKYIGLFAFNKCGKLAEINTLGAITQINSYTFNECFSLASVTIPKGVTYIGESAFNHCGQITSLTLPDSLEIIDRMAFASCENLADFSIPENVIKIGYYAFVGCKKLSEITLPFALTEVEEGVFASCEGLTAINIPDGVSVIKNSAFNSCTALSEVILPQSVVKIEPFAFYGCHNLRKLIVQNFAAEIMFNAFLQCKNLVTNLSINEWDREWGIAKLDYALHYMRNFKAGDTFFEDTKAENKRYIRRQLFNILKRGNPDYPYVWQLATRDIFGLRPCDTNAVVFLTDEIPLRIDEVEILLDKMQGNPEASAILLDYKVKNFTEEFLEKYENDKLQKELGLKERTVAEWKKIFRIGDDGNGGYKILGYKGKDVNVEIPEKIGKKPVTAIGEYAFSPEAPFITQEIRYTRSMLETVIIPDSVTSMGCYMFVECCRLNSIVYQGKAFSPEEFDKCFRDIYPFAVPIIIGE